MSKSCLYILVFPQPGLLKLGISSSVVPDARHLADFLGKPDWDRSFTVAGPARALESLLHGIEHLLEPQLIEIGDVGISGVYEVAALATALNYVRIHAMLGRGGAMLQRGLPKPRGARALRKSVMLAARSRETAESVSRAADCFSRLNRLLLVLAARSARYGIRFEYIDDGACLRLSVSADARTHLPTAESFHLSFADLSGTTVCDWILCERGRHSCRPRNPVSEPYKC